MMRLLRLGIFASFALLAAAKDPSLRKQPQPFSYRHEQISEGPWSIHVVAIDRSCHGLELQTTLPAGRHFGLATLSQQISAFSAPAHVIAAINGDYYERHGPYVGDPQGLQIMDGELVSGPCDWTCFWVDPSGNPKIDKVESHFTVVLPSGEQLPFTLNEQRADNKAVIYTTVVGATTHTDGGAELVLEMNPKSAQLPIRPQENYFARITECRKSGNSPTATNRVVLSIGPKLLSKIASPEKGDTVRVSTATVPSLRNVSVAIGGGPTLVRESRAVFPSTTPIRHPRSAIGWNKESFFLVEVDGRQPDLSVGMTFEELAKYLVKLGCTDAICLDGGGSATLWAKGQVMNNPCEGGERGTGNALVVLNK